MEQLLIILQVDNLINLFSYVNINDFIVNSISKNKQATRKEIETIGKYHKEAKDY